MSVRGGRYELIRPIASGGMATVHLGRAVGAGGFERLVAIKVMHAHLAEEPEFVAMFHDEARLAAMVRHPNVVGTIDIQQDEQGLFLVMDYIEGPSLQRVLRALARQQHSRPPLDVALRIFVDALAGLHAAHETCGPNGESLNLIHRDVSPQNILIGVDGVAKITDFGVARAESRLMTTRAGVLKGKVCYMAPEQILSHSIDRRIDVYAAGVLLWEMLVGQRLIRGENDGAMMERVLRAKHPAPRDVIPATPEAISAACMRALSASPENRFPTAAAFAEAIEAAASEGVAIATPRVVSAHIKGLGLEPAEPSQPLREAPLASQALRGAPLASQALRGAPLAAQALRGAPLATSPTNSDEVPASSGAQGISAATSAPSSHTPIYTLLSSPKTEAPPHRSARSALRWAGPAILALLGVAAWILFTWGPLKVSWRDDDVSPAATASATDADRGTAASSTVIAQTPPPSNAPQRASAAVPPAGNADRAPAGTPAPKPKVHKPEADPASFRPKDL
jgi:serine/threonine-protein kinase